jgi:hypothetical protein
MRRNKVTEQKKISSKKVFDTILFTFIFVILQAAVVYTKNYQREGKVRCKVAKPSDLTMSLLIFNPFS